MNQERAPRLLIRTKSQGIFAVAITALLLIARFRSALSAQPASWTWMFSGIFPRFAVVAVNVAFCVFLVWMSVSLATAPLRKDEKSLCISFLTNLLLVPVGALLPSYIGIVDWVRTFAMFLAFVSSLIILRSFWDIRRPNSDEEKAPA